MKVGKNMMVSLVYELKESGTDGRILESLNDNKPLNFVFGTGRLLPLFEENINLLSAGDDFSFLLKSEMAYGERREEMIIDVPRSVFENDGMLNEDICRIGNEVPMMDSEGNQLSGVVNEISESFVKMDFNHPMAGIDLHFTGKILDVREATESEIAGTHHSSCSGCGSSENSGCSGSCS